MAESKPFVTRNEIKCYRDIIDRYKIIKIHFRLNNVS